MDETLIERIRQYLATIRSLWETTLLADNRIEPIPCGEREWESGDGRPTCGP